VQVNKEISGYGDAFGTSSIASRRIKVEDYSLIAVSSLFRITTTSTTIVTTVATYPLY
jgi:hypothetical protein